MKVIFPKLLKIILPLSASKLFESQNRESPYLLMLEERRKETKSKLDNIMKVLEDGGGEFMRFKQRYVELEGELKEIEIKIDKEMLVRPNFSLEHIEETFSFFAGLDLENEEDRQRLVDVFLNSVFVHNNGDIDIVFNYMTAKKTIKIDEFGSAFKLRGSPNESYERSRCGAFFRALSPRLP